MAKYANPADRPAPTPRQQADIDVAVTKYEFDNACESIERKALDTIARLAYAIRDIRDALASAQGTEQTGLGLGMSVENIDRERERRLGYLAQQTIDTVLSQVGDMNLGYVTRDLAKVGPARLAKVAALGRQKGVYAQEETREAVERERAEREG